MTTQIASDEKFGGVISLEPCPTKSLNTGLKDPFSLGAAVILDLSQQWLKIENKEQVKERQTPYA